jgi:hypothetical protein
MKSCALIFGIALSAWALAGEARGSLITNGGFGDPDGNFTNNTGSVAMMSPSAPPISPAGPSRATTPCCGSRPAAFMAG